MKNKIWIVIAFVFAAVMISAVILYPKLSETLLDKDVVAPPEFKEAEDGEENLVNGSDGADDGEGAGSTNTVKTDDFTVYDSELSPVKLSEHFGKPIIINFWASWCYPCRSELYAFDAMYKKYGEDVVFLMVNLTDGQRDTVSGVKKFVSNGGYEFPVYYDVEYDAANTYGIYSIPETVFVNSDGSLYGTKVGAMSEVTLEKYIKTLLGRQ